MPRRQTDRSGSAIGSPTPARRSALVTLKVSGYAFWTDRAGPRLDQCFPFIGKLRTPSSDLGDPFANPLRFLLNFVELHDESADALMVGFVGQNSSPIVICAIGSPQIWPARGREAPPPVACC